MTTVSLIAAMDKARVIGKDNQLPWRMPADLAHFKQVTMGKPVVMGRKTWESLGRPLPGRLNIVVTRDRAFSCEGCSVAHSIEAALELAAGHDEVMIIGGASFYGQMLARADRMYLTRIDAEVDGDAWFPQWDEDEWQEVSRESRPADEKNQYDCSFVTLERR